MPYRQLVMYLLSLTANSTATEDEDEKEWQADCQVSKLQDPTPPRHRKLQKHRLTTNN